MKFSRRWIAGAAVLWLALPAASEEVPAEGVVARATFTSGIEDREPVDVFKTLSNENVQAIFFTELRGLAGQTVNHRWEYAGKLMGEVPFSVAGDRWRVWSSKNLEPGWVGEWTVSVVDASGKVLRSETLTYAEVPAVPAAPAEAPAEVPAAATPADTPEADAGQVATPNAQ